MPADTEGLLAEPHETLEVQFKEWLDLTDNNHRALVAKEIIALANHGGGFLIAGFRELDDGTFEPALPRPANLNDWSQDAVQSIVAKYVEPAVQCRVIHQTAPSKQRYPVIVVPGGHRVPVLAKSGSPDGKLVPSRVYVRRPGPASEEPKTSGEWSALFERILQDRKAELLEAMRSIMAGEIPTATHEISPIDALSHFEQTAISRWQARTKDLPPTSTARLPHGSYDVGIKIDRDFPEPSIDGLRETIRQAVRNHSGWPPFLTLDRVPFSPKPIDGAVEFWPGPDTDGSVDVPARHDFWRASPKGLLFTRRGYREDGGKSESQAWSPKKYFHLTTATWRLGEIILEAAYIARGLKAGDVNLTIHTVWRGLAGRELTAVGTSRYLSEHYVAEQDTFETTRTIALDAIPAALPEVVFEMLAPLYEFFETNSLL